MVSLEAQEHGPDSNKVIVIFREVIELKATLYIEEPEASNYPKDSEWFDTLSLQANNFSLMSGHPP